MRYSYSNLSTWQKCPRQWEAKYVTKTYPHEDTPALRRGQEVHATLEAAIGAQVDPPSDLWMPEGLVPLLHRADARVETKIEIHKPAHLMGYLDVCIVGPDYVAVIDWKTGKMRSPDPLQADVYAMLVRRAWGIDDVSFTWVGVDAKRALTTHPDANAERRVMSIINDIETNGKYPPTPSWLCRFCPLTWCEHNEKRG